MAVKSEQCPSCNSDDNLKIFDNGSSFCFTPDCAYNETKKNIVNDTPKDLVEGVYSTIAGRRLSQRTCEFFSYQMGTYQGQQCHIANYRDPTGKVVAQKIRLEGKKFVWTGEPSKATFFGRHLWSNKSNNLIICEGELDSLSVAEAQQCKWPVVSIPNGAQSAAKTIKQELEWLNGFKEIVLCFDMDEAGQRAVEECVQLFPPGKVRIANLSKKDANEVLVAGKTQELTNLVWNATEYRPDGIEAGSEINLDEVFKDEPLGLTLPYPLLTNMLRGLKKGRLYTVYAGCVDEETEFLTQTGWKKISDYNGEKVGQYNQGKLEFVRPDKYWKLPADKFYHLKTTRGVDMMLTPEHTVYYKYSGDSKPTTIKMEDLYKQNKSKPSGFQGKFFTTFTYSGSGLDYTEGELRLQVAVKADGRIVKEGKNNYTQMRFNKKRKYERLLNLCLKFNLPFKDRGLNNQGQYEIIVWPKSREKHYTTKYYDCTQEQFAIIFDEMKYWDGTHIHSLSFFAKSKEDIDFMQFCGAICGFRGTFSQDSKGIYAISFSKQTMVGIASRHSNNITEVRIKNAFKYCFTMPEKTWIARRNGKIFVTHNTGNGKSSFMKECVYHIRVKHPEIKIANIYLEESKKTTIKSYIALDNNTPYYLLDENKNILSEAQRKSSYDKVINAVDSEEKMFFYKHFGSLDAKRLFGLLEYLAVGKGVELVVLDHISILVSGLEQFQEGERRAIDFIMTSLRAFSERTGCIILLATQLKRVEGSYNNGAEISESSARGAGSIEHISDAIISLNCNQELNPNTAQIKVLKNRVAGMRGNADLITYDNKTGRYLPEKKIVEKNTDLPWVPDDEELI